MVLYSVNLFKYIILLYMRALERGEILDAKLLIKQAKRGDKEALLKLIMDKKDEYYKLAYVYLKNREDSLDALQDMIIILYENIHKLKKEEAFYSWSKTILVNCCKKILKVRNKTIPFEKIDLHGDHGDYEEKEAQIVLDVYLSKLSPIYAEAIKLKYLLDLDYKTISDILQIPEGTVKSRISKGMKKLKEEVGGEN